MNKIKDIREKVEHILSPLKPAHEINSFLFLKRSNSSERLLTYYLVYFLFSELLKYKNIGQFEKIAWSFPVYYKDKLFAIEHRKFGVGVFVSDPETDSKDADELIIKINSAIKIAIPFFDTIAEKAVRRSELNINNRNGELFERFVYLRKLYNKEQNLYKKKERTNSYKNQRNKIRKINNHKKSWENTFLQFKSSCNFLYRSVLQLDRALIYSPRNNSRRSE